MLAIKNGKLITPHRVIPQGSIIINEGVIKEVIEGNWDERCGHITDTHIIDADGLYISPGFIDIHVHGGGGGSSEDLTESSIIQMAKAHCAHGTTGIVPTLSTAPDESLYRAADAVMAAQKKAPNVLGIHYEGPCISVAQKGAQNEAFIKNPLDFEYERILDYWDKILIMGAAPELPGGLELGRVLRQRGICSSVAHSDANYSEMLRALENGYSDVTHLYSGCSIVHRVNAYRIAGVVESAFLLDGFTVQVIADGKHLPPELLKLIYKIKGSDKISLITDGLRYSATEMEEGTVFKEGGQDVVFEDGVMKLIDRESFAGSVVTTDRLVRNMVELAQVPLQEAVKMASLTPARVIGMDNRKGQLAKGYDADIVLFDGNINIQNVIVGGEIV